MAQILGASMVIGFVIFIFAGVICHYNTPKSFFGLLVRVSIPGFGLAFLLVLSDYGKDLLFTFLVAVVSILIVFFLLLLNYKDSILPSAENDEKAPISLNLSKTDDKK